MEQNFFEYSDYQEVNMPFWQRLLITVGAMLVASFLVSLIWRSVFNILMPGYLSGIVGGLTALPVWEFLKRIKLKDKNVN